MNLFETSFYCIIIGKNQYLLHIMPFLDDRYDLARQDWWTGCHHFSMSKLQFELAWKSIYQKWQYVIINIYSRLLAFTRVSSQNHRVISHGDWTMTHASLMKLAIITPLIIFESSNHIVRLISFAGVDMKHSTNDICCGFSGSSTVAKYTRIILKKGLTWIVLTSSGMALGVQDWSQVHSTTSNLTYPLILFLFHRFWIQCPHHDIQLLEHSLCNLAFPWYLHEDGMNFQQHEKHDHQTFEIIHHINSMGHRLWHDLNLRMALFFSLITKT